MTNTIVSLSSKGLVVATGYGGGPPLSAQQRKFTQRIFYQLNLDKLEKTASDQGKKFDRPQQKMQSTNEILQ